MAETEAVTVVFTDLVASTELAVALSAVAAERLRQEHFSLLRSAVDATGGIEVKNLGDGLMVAFTSPSRALACAVAMQQALARRNRRSDTKLSLRVGISAGEARADEGDYFGDPVIEAAGLCALADGGQILATDVVRLMVGRHAAQELVPVGALALKGLPEPVPPVEVRWEPMVDEPDDAGSSPLPGRLAQIGGDGLFAFFGRAEELAAIESAAKEAAAGSLRIVMVGGEPGVGKSTLVARVARSLHSSGAAVAYGAAEEALGAPYQPWVTAMTDLVGGAPPEELPNSVRCTPVPWVGSYLATTRYSTVVRPRTDPRLTG